MDDRTQLKQFILQLSSEASQYLRNHFYTFKNVFQKDVGSVSTNVDLQLEEIITKRIQKEFPTHGIIVHGSKSISPESDYVWIVDPLDGSSHFSRSIPIYTVNIALQYKGETIFGTVNHAQTHQLYFAQKGKGAFLNGIDIFVSNKTDLSQSYVFIEMPEKKFSKQGDIEHDFENNMLKVSELVKKSAQVESFRIGAFGQCLVASGAFDAYVDLSGSSQVLSQAASQLIVKEAGGKIIDIGEKKEGFVQVMATNGHLSNELRKIVK
jgi:myo-inositol-1(or 4)-monophosphatase